MTLMVRCIVAVISIHLIIRCSLASSINCNKADSSVRYFGNTVEYCGEINSEAGRKLIDIITTADDIKSLTITSPGGDPEVGMLIGNLIREKSIEVNVKDYCFSACANYVALSARRLNVGTGSYLGFHGGLPTAEESMRGFKNIVRNSLHGSGLKVDEVERIVNASAKRQYDKDRRLRTMEEEFFQRLRISRRILDDSAFNKGVTGPNRLLMFEKSILEECYGVRTVDTYPEYNTGSHLVRKGDVKVQCIVVDSCPAR